jgi:hypothetical protein
MLETPNETIRTWIESWGQYRRIQEVKEAEISVLSPKAKAPFSLS